MSIDHVGRESELRRDASKSRDGCRSGTDVRMSGRWPSIRLEDACARVTDGTHQSPRFEPHGIPFLVISDIVSGEIDWSRVSKWVNEATYEANTSRCRPERGDVLYTAVGSFGVAVPVETDQRFMFQRHIAHIKPDPRCLHTRFLAHILNSPAMRAVAERVAKGVAQRTVTLGDLKSFEIPLPPLAEQRRSADILDKANAIRRKRKEAIALTEELLRSTFLDMFGDPVTNPKGWEVRQLEEVVQEGTVVTYGIVQAGEHIPDGVPYVRTGDLKDGRIKVDSLLRTSRDIASRYRRSEVRCGDIVMSIRATVGTVAIVPRELDGANLTQGTARIAPGPLVTRDYLYQHIRAAGMQHWIQERVKGATFKEITLAALRTAPIMLPARQLQERFSRLCAELATVRARQEASTQEAFVLFNSLVQTAFSGRLAIPEAS